MTLENTLTKKFFFTLVSILPILFVCLLPCHSLPSEKVIPFHQIENNQRILYREYSEEGTQWREFKEEHNRWRVIKAGTPAWLEDIAKGPFFGWENKPIFGNITVKEVDLLDKTFSKLPDKTKFLVNSLYIPSRIGEVLTEDGKFDASVAGCSGGGVVFVAHDVLNQENLPEVLYHEVGHLLDTHLKRPSTLAPWGQPPFVSEYASRSAREDFAESFAEYVISGGNITDTSHPSFTKRKTIQELIERL